MNNVPRIPLDDESVFRQVGGLWKGTRAPLVSAQVIRSTNFRGDGLLDYDDVAQLDVEERQLQVRRPARHDIIVERSGGGPKQPVGRVALFDGKDGDTYATSNFTTSIRIVNQSRLNPLFVSLYLHHLYLQGATQPLQRATTGLRNLAWSEFLKFEVPLPSLSEQREIGHLLAFARELYVKEQQQLDLSVQLKQAAMRELFTRGLRGEAQKELEFSQSPESWRLSLLSDVAEVQTGAAKGRKFVNTDVVDVPYLRVANVQDGHLDLSEMKTLRIRRTEIERYRLRDGDVVLTEGGDFDKLGRGFIWRAELPLCIHQNHVFAVRTNRAVLDPEFFAYLAQSPYGKAYFLQVAHKTTNLACINSNKLKAFPVVLPTLEDQHEIAHILKAIDRKIDIHKKKRVVLEDLFKSLLHKLMTGEIRVSDLNLSALGEPPLLASREPV